MPLPWLRLIDGVIGATDLVRWARGRAPGASTGVARGLESRLVATIVGALREAFDRDHERLEIERRRIEEERLRAERALRLELLRQAGDREIGRLRLLASVSVACLLGTLFLVTRLVGGTAMARASLGLGWLMLIAAFAAALAGQSTIARSLAHSDDHLAIDDVTSSSGGVAAAWLIVAGLASVALGILIA